MKPSVLLLAPLLFTLTACDNDPAKGKAQATVAAATSAAPVAAGAAKLAFSNDGSKVEYVGAKITGKHAGGFGSFKGTVSLVDGNPEKSQVTVEIETASLTSDSDMLTGHLKGADFFDVAKFPKATFTSTAIKAGGSGGATHTITGNLELHGVSKSVSFPATVRVGADSADVDAEFAINRKDFGIVYAGKPDDLIKDDVAIKLTVRAKKAS
ncbi:MAG: YceI family protein [Deltaproteobacteria bacterium]|nr:YceI family protein [Deltaproteobacteria bacterium]